MHQISIVYTEDQLVLCWLS